MMDALRCCSLELRVVFVMVPDHMHMRALVYRSRELKIIPPYRFASDDLLSLPSQQ